MRKKEKVLAGLDRRSFLRGTAGALLLATVSGRAVLAQEAKPTQLPPAQPEGGKRLMVALKERKSSRSFSDRKLPPQVLANLLWAAAGVNRPDSGGRTAPTASNSQDMDIYVAMAEGLFLYDAKGQTLVPILTEDIRAITGRQPYVKDAPVNLIYVSDFARMKAAPEDRVFYSGAHTGFIAQNVYLYCASEGLACVVRANVERPPLAQKIGLRPDQHITLTHSIGYPKPA
ncbi:MAG TPA: nitroreductase family protein [Candidatus Sulfotelmatobacter sp.]|nr:nitroreductase family protein [Candidatus Sulfotelmatobacter sp.]